MRKNKLSLLAITAIVCLLASQAYSQWTFRGFVVGAGTFPSISVYDSNKAIIAGGPNGSAFVSRTTNGGTTWTSTGTSGITLEVYCVWAVDDNTIYVGDGGASGGTGGNAKVYKTTNGGTLWSVILSTGGTLGFINGIVFSKTNPQVGVCQSDPPAGSGVYWIAKTTNNGTSWTPEAPTGSGSASSQNSIVCIDAQFYGFGLNSAPARVGVTSNGGTSWTYSTLVGAGGTFISGFAMKDDKLNGFASGNTLASTLARTTNGGTSWFSQSVGTGMTGYCNIKWVHGSNLVYITGAVGAGGCVKRSTDGGVTWAQMTTGGITGITHMEYWKAPSGVVYLYAVAADGSVIRYVDNSLVGIDPNNQTVPNSFALEQNYPNPFNPSTTIKYSVPQSGNVTIKVYNSLGEVVRTVVDNYHTTGNYIESVDMDGMSSGIYYYTMLAGDFKDTKRMVLVK